MKPQKIIFIIAMMLSLSHAFAAEEFSSIVPEVAPTPLPTNIPNLTAYELKDERLTLGAPYRMASSNSQEMRVINSGVASLYQRIDMIRRATKTIELETYIFNADTSGRLILQELVAAAKRGVKVRMLIDKASINLKIDEHYAQVLKESGIEVRYYNKAPMLNVSTVQYRNHRKLLVIDDKEAVTGGRNIADEYFDLSEKFNFLDRDTSIEGDIVKPIKETFDLYWNSKMTEVATPRLPPEPTHPSEHEGDHNFDERAMDTYNKTMAKTRKSFEMTPKDQKALDFVMSTGKKELEKNNKYQCPEVSFATDREGAGFIKSLSPQYRRDFRLLRKEISKWMREKIKTELTIDTPYFLDNNFTPDIADKLSKNIKVNVFTNSLASTDAIHVASVFSDSVTQFTPNENFKAYTYKGKFPDESEVLNDKIKNSTWGTHSKTIVFNDDAFMIGTFNMDNRSEQYNSELAVFCSGSKELTADVQNNIKKRMSGSNRLNTEGEPDDCSGHFGEVSGMKKALYYLIKVPSHLLQFLL